MPALWPSRIPDEARRGGEVEQPVRWRAALGRCMVRPKLGQFRPLRSPVCWHHSPLPACFPALDSLDRLRPPGQPGPARTPRRCLAQISPSPDWSAAMICQLNLPRPTKVERRPRCLSFLFSFSSFSPVILQSIFYLTSLKYLALSTSVAHALYLIFPTHNFRSFPPIISTIFIRAIIN